MSKKYKKICPYCGKEFETNRPNKIYCSLWNKILTQIKNDGKLATYLLLKEVKNVFISKDEFYIVFNDNFLLVKPILNDKETKKYIESVIKDKTNCAFKMKLEFESTCK